MLYLFRQWRENKIPKDVTIAKNEPNSWFVFNHDPTPVFPHSGYLRNDGTWAASMKKRDGYLGYFHSRDEALSALLKFV